MPCSLPHVVIPFALGAPYLLSSDIKGQLVEQVRLNFDFIRCTVCQHGRELVKKRKSIILAEENYWKWIQLLKNHPACNLQPSKIIVLIWHLHHLDPRGYENDMAILGIDLETQRGWYERMSPCQWRWSLRHRFNCFSRRVVQSTSSHFRRSLLEEATPCSSSSSLPSSSAVVVLVEAMPCSSPPSLTMSPEFIEAYLQAEIRFAEAVSCLNPMTDEKIREAIEDFERFLMLKTPEGLNNTYYIPTVGIRLVWQTLMKMLPQFMSESENFNALKEINYVRRLNLSERVRDWWRTETERIWKENYEKDYVSKKDPWRTFTGKVAKPRRSSPRRWEKGWSGPSPSSSLGGWEVGCCGDSGCGWDCGD